mmetsp:Transcript_107363/g.181514  ORF Transcript_107363/g.181514 Transcript_107363/m.181514 type:complete len:91 (+) Transcript_107363:264-536(+)
MSYRLTSKWSLASGHFQARKCHLKRRWLLDEITCPPPPPPPPPPQKKLWCIVLVGVWPNWWVYGQIPVSLANKVTAQHDASWDKKPVFIR